MDLVSCGKLKIYVGSYNNKINEYNFTWVFNFPKRETRFNPHHSVFSMRNEVYYCPVTHEFATFHAKQTPSHTALCFQYDIWSKSKEITT